MPVTIYNSHPASDGAGVKLQRVHGFAENGLDPFLMLDEIHSDNPDDYLAGFPPHPHRGIETLTYIRHGGFIHEDHMGNKGEISSGGAQWMSAGKGVIHSEKPLLAEGLLHGFQLWINLPKASKMQPPQYRDINAAELPWQTVSDGAEIKVIAGSFTLNQQAYSGPLHTTAPASVADLVINESSQSFELQTDPEANLLLFAHSGDLLITDSEGSHRLPAKQMAQISSQSSISLQAASGQCGVLMLSGRPIREPVVQHGPFVMNTQEEIRQAIRDYQSGTLTD